MEQAAVVRGGERFNMGTGVTGPVIRRSHGYRYTPQPSVVSASSVAGGSDLQAPALEGSMGHSSSSQPAAGSSSSQPNASLLRGPPTRSAAAPAFASPEVVARQVRAERLGLEARRAALGSEAASEDRRSMEEFERRVNAAQVRFAPTPLPGASREGTLPTSPSRRTETQEQLPGAEDADSFSDHPDPSPGLAVGPARSFSVISQQGSSSTEHLRFWISFVRFIAALILGLYWMGIALSKDFALPPRAFFYVLAFVQSFLNGRILLTAVETPLPVARAAAISAQFVLPLAHVLLFETIKDGSSRALAWVGVGMSVVQILGAAASRKL